MAGPFIPAPYVTLKRPPTPIVPRSRVDPETDALVAALRQRLQDALADARQHREDAIKWRAEAALLLRKLDPSYVASPFVDVGAPARAKRIKADIAEKYGVTVEQIDGPGRAPPKLIIARQEAMAEVAKACPGWSLPIIGRFFGGRDHSTVIYTLKKMGVIR